MKYLKTFEHFSGYDMGHRFSEEDELEMYSDDPMMTHSEEEEEEECVPCSTEEEEDYTGLKDVHKKWYDKNVHGEEEEEGSKVWGDEVVEGKKAKPDFLDLDKDGDKKESMKKAAKEAKSKAHKKDDKEGKGLSAAQKKLPAGLQKAILSKKK